MAAPFEVITEPVGSKAPFEKIKLALRKYQSNTIDHLPPMQGGVAGVFSYDLNRSLENINATLYDDFKTPAVAVGIYDVVIAWDHETSEAWLMSQGFPETEPNARAKRAEERADFFMQQIEQSLDQVEENGDPETVVLPEKLETPLHAVRDDGDANLRSNFAPEAYVATVQRCIDYIYAGDVFQINLSQQLMTPATSDSLTLYESLRSCNASTFGGYFDLSMITNTDLQVISASPERFFSVRNRRVETRPIKGTRRRTGKPQVDIREQDRLIASEKDRAENTMIVDLMRNDLSTVCDDDSICVTQLCELETYRSVLHLVSAVEGELREECDLVDLLMAVFPGGSITGAPKIRAMEIIAELEPTTRGFYCGSMGYLGFNGDADLNILIRTVTASKGWWQIPVGGGIVSQSESLNEYQETWTKASAMLNAAHEAAR